MSVYSESARFYRNLVTLEESKTILADLEREHKLNIEKAKQIVTEAEAEAKNIINQAKKEVRVAIERKVQLAEDQIKAAEAMVIKGIKEKAIDQSILMAESELLRKSQARKSAIGIADSLKELETGIRRL